MTYRRGIDACALWRDERARTLLVPSAAGRWSLPGAAIQHGEHPADAVRRGVAEQTGQVVAVTRAREVVTDIGQEPGGWVHRDQIVFEVEPTDSVPDILPGGTWVAAADLAEHRLTLVAARSLGLASASADNHRVKNVSWAAVPGSSANRRQRFAAYAYATDPAGNILLTLISDGYPGAGRWHLPGGGTDFGETVETGLSREMVEETGQRGEIGRLVSVSHRHQTDLRGPERVAMDWHGVRVVYAVRVPEPTTPRVVDGGGSTAAAAWFPRAKAAALPLTEVAIEMVQKVTH